MSMLSKLFKERDFSQIVDVTFAFLKENFLDMSKVLFKILGIPLLISSCLGAYMTNFTGIANMSDPNYFINNGFGALLENIPLFSVSILIQMYIGVFTGLTIMNYMLLYFKNDGIAPTASEVFEASKNKLWPYIKMILTFALMIGGYVLVAALLGTGVATLSGAGFIFGLGIFLFSIFWLVVLFRFILTSWVIIDENFSTINSFKYSYTLIKDHWWQTFGIVAVFGLLGSILSVFFSVPNLIYTSVLSVTDLMSKAGALKYVWFTISVSMTFITSFGQLFIQALSMVALGFQYGSLKEETEGLGLASDIENLDI